MAVGGREETSTERGKSRSSIITASVSCSDRGNAIAEERKEVSTQELDFSVPCLHSSTTGLLPTITGHYCLETAIMDAEESHLGRDADSSSENQSSSAPPTLPDSQERKKGPRSTGSH